MERMAVKSAVADRMSVREAEGGRRWPFRWHCRWCSHSGAGAGAGAGGAKGVVAPVTASAITIDGSTPSECLQRRLLPRCGRRGQNLRVCNYRLLLLPFPAFHRCRLLPLLLLFVLFLSSFEMLGLYSCYQGQGKAGREALSSRYFRNRSSHLVLFFVLHLFLLLFLVIIKCKSRIWQTTFYLGLDAIRSMCDAVSAVRAPALFVHLRLLRCRWGGRGGRGGGDRHPPGVDVVKLGGGDWISTSIAPALFVGHIITHGAGRRWSVVGHRFRLAVDKQASPVAPARGWRIRKACECCEVHGGERQRQVDESVLGYEFPGASVSSPRCPRLQKQHHRNGCT